MPHQSHSSSQSHVSSVTLHVQHPTQKAIYPITIQSGLLNHSTDFQQSIPSLTRDKAQRVLIVTDSNVGKIYKKSITQQFVKMGLSVKSITLPAGESSKCWAQAERIYQAALHQGLTRNDLFIALGGGVIGDITGYCAATYHRGTPYIQLPTTLLAQVDSSVGGKVAIHVGGVKNSVGAFYHPIAVCIDPNTLSTLPLREWQAGFAEVVKYGLIEQTAQPNQPACFLNELRVFFDDCPSPTPAFKDRLLNTDNSPLNRWIEHCCRLKQAVVQADETEQNGQRMILNLGHTFAHILESATNYTEFLHGEAVALGLIAACRYSQSLGLIHTDFTQSIIQRLEQIGLPTRIPSSVNIDPETALMWLRHDKKNRSNWPPFILPIEPIGQVKAHHTNNEDTLRTMLTDWLTP